MNDWSDSDDEGPSGIETSVLLGVPDGPIDVPSDLSDAAVSRIGGHPAFLPSSEPPITSSHCKVCDNPMELLVQMWCPFENSPMDRALYVWGCARMTCQKKQGSVRAWRGLRYNEKYAAKLKKKQELREEKRKAKADALEAAKLPKANPFSTNVAANVPAFGLGTQIFGEDPPDSNVSDSEDENEESDDDADSEASSLVTALTRTVISDSPWQSAPAYKPVYLSTVSEYLPPQPKQKLSSASQGDMDDATGAWMSEKYENSMYVDPIFERFTRRVAAEGEQCVRYELGGVPLPFASDEVYQKLFPPAKHGYEPSGVEACPGCQSKRLFECQLMPNLINVVRPRLTEKGQQTDEERRAEIAGALRGGEGMSWGTCLVFSCSGDCSLSEWREEAVYIEWD